MLGVDALSLVRHAHNSRVSSVLRLDRNWSRRKLASILDEVVQRTLEALAVRPRVEPIGNVDRDPVTIGSIGKAIDHRIYGDRQIYGTELQFEPPDLGSCQVENLGDDAAHALGVDVDGFDELKSLFVGEPIPPLDQGRGKPLDRGQRRPQLMARARYEFCKTGFIGH